LSMIIQNGGPLLSHRELVLFPFDNYALPFQNGVELNLIGHTSPPGRTKIVLGLGDENSPDSKQVVYYGSVHRVGDELWMWYLGQGDDNEWFERVCLATSRDGIHWEKPKLGLVEYKGNKNNNLVDLNQGSHHVQACVVFYEPDEPDPQRRFKMAFECDKYDKVFAVAYSADGLTWHESPNNPVGRWYEMAGGAKFNGCYYLAGQGGNHIGGMRQLVTYVSYDFEQWSSASCLGLRRAFSVHQPRPFGRNAGEQVHLGAALWNRGNILIGFYGMWHGHISNDRRLLTMDLGMAMTTDALHYYEPIPDFPIVSAAEDGWGRPPHGHTAVHFPALIQGQGFENIGDQTLFWYAPWPEQKSDGVRVAIWERDRLGYFRAFLGERMHSIEEAHFVSAPIDLEGRSAQLLLNIDGLTPHSGVTVEILDERFEPLPGYSAEQCLAPSEGGFEQPIRWQEQESIRHTAGPIRVRVNFTGLRAEDVRLYALYLREVTQ
jgi:hypothetical protein